jgi:Glucose-6-phosphate dehydrogenase, C-terminal domain
VRIEASVGHARSAPERTGSFSLRKRHASRSIVNPANGHSRDFPNYAAGTWGPEAADGLLARDEREWRPQAAARVALVAS